MPGEWPGLPILGPETDLAEALRQLSACNAWVANELATCRLDKDGTDAYAKLISECRRALEGERVERYRLARVDLAQKRATLQEAQFQHSSRELEEMREMEKRAEEREERALQRQAERRQKTDGASRN